MTTFRHLFHKIKSRVFHLRLSRLVRDSEATFNRYAIYLIIILAVIAVILAIAIFREAIPKRARPTRQEPPTQQISPAPSSAPNASSPEEKQQLLGIRQDSSEEEKKRHADLVQRLARDAAYLDITDCDPQPIVMRLKDGGEFTVKNSDAGEREIGIDPQHIYTIPGRGERKIKVDFGHGPGVYGYGCNKSSGAVGMFLVVP